MIYELWSQLDKLVEWLCDAILLGLNDVPGAFNMLKVLPYLGH